MSAQQRAAGTGSNSNQTTALTKFEKLRIASEVLTDEASALSRLSKKIPEDFCDAVDLVSACTGVVIVTGVGKAGWIGQKVSASLASTGTPSHFLHPAEAIHGDLGRVGPNDVIMVFSNSGETNEIATLLPTLAKFKTPIIAVTGNSNSTLSSYSAATLNYGKVPEACHLGLAPTTSTTLMLALGDALTIAVSRVKEFQPVDFAKFHPGGSLGKQLSSVDEVMRPLDQCRVANEKETVREVYVRHSGQGRRAGAVLIVSGESAHNGVTTGVLTGIFTDSDLARLLERQQDQLFDQAIGSVMTKSPITISSGSKTMLAIETLACRNLSELPVVNQQGIAIGLIDITDVVNVGS